MFTPARFLLVIVGAASLTACAAGQQFNGAPGGKAGVLPQGRTIAKQPLPESIRHKDLLYIVAGPYIDVFSFPEGKPLQQISEDYPFGLCVNRRGDVFAVDMVADAVFEYAHGASAPIATLSFPDSNPTQCAADARTGDVAVISGAGAVRARRDQTHDVWVYRHGKGTPTEYPLSGMSYIDYAAYDENGDLFIDGYSDSYYSPRTFALAELPYGQKTFEAIRPDQAILNRIRGFSAIQWIGKELAVGNSTEYPQASIDRIRIKGNKAEFAHHTALVDSQGIGAFWIQNETAVVPTYSGGTGLWHFPRGGKPFATIPVSSTGGVAVSLGK